jgi:hypothetical protein
MVIKIDGEAFMIALPQSADEQAIELLDRVINLQMTLNAGLVRLPSEGKTIIWEKLLEFAKKIAHQTGCPTGDIIWGSSKSSSIESNEAILASISSELDYLKTSLDYAAHSALFTLNAVALISRAQAIAQYPRLKDEIESVRSKLGELIDQIMEQ